MEEWLSITRFGRAGAGASAIVAVLVSQALFSTLPVKAASFDCTMTATAVEKMICGDPELSQLDEALGRIYAEARVQAADADTIKSEQRAWLHDKRDACPDLACLKWVYERRIGVLEIAAWPVGGRGVERTRRLPADIASINCHKATTGVERKVCAGEVLDNDHRLERLLDFDQRLEEFFAYALRYAPNPETLISEQRAWMRGTRDACRNQDCLGAAYRARLAEVVRIGGMAPVDDPAFAVDRADYAAKARQVLANLLANREFKPFRLSPPENQKQGMLLLQKLRASDYEIVAPFEWSDSRPDLPTYMAARKRCADYDFEFIRINRGQLLRATENFGLYEVSSPGAGSDAERLLVYRAERYVTHWVDWDRHRVRRDDEHMFVGGEFFIFPADGCIVPEPESFYRQVDNMARSKYFSEIVKINQEYFMVNLRLTNETTYGHYRIQFDGIAKAESERQSFVIVSED